MLARSHFRAYVRIGDNVVVQRAKLQSSRMPDGLNARPFDPKGLRVLVKLLKDFGNQTAAGFMT